MRWLSLIPLFLHVLGIVVCVDLLRRGPWSRLIIVRYTSWISMMAVYAWARFDHLWRVLANGHDPLDVARIIAGSVGPALMFLGLLALWWDAREGER